MAVLTGDLVDSRKALHIDALIQALIGIFDDVKRFSTIDFDSELFRGDSFQIVVRNPEDALRLALLIRIGLKSKTILARDDYASKSKLLPVQRLWDARIAIGIGAASINSSLAISNGEAFQQSGLEFDKLKQERRRLTIKTSWKLYNDQFGIIIKLVDALLEKWTNLTSEVVYEILLKGLTQSEIAKLLNISQPAVHKRLSIANIDVVQEAIDYISTKIVEAQQNGV